MAPIPGIGSDRAMGWLDSVKAMFSRSPLSAEDLEDRRIRGEFFRFMDEEVLLQRRDAFLAVIISADQILQDVSALAR